MPTLREWTILLYMAGDNGKTFQTKQGNYSLMAEMTTPGYRDIDEVEKIGTTDQVAVLAQFDTQGDEGTFRFEIHQGRTTEQNLVEKIPETNTGDPSDLSKFIVWGMSRCPARRTMLVLWNHGLGWKDDDVYQTVRSVSRSASQGRKPRQVNAPMFRTTARAIDKKARRAKNPTTRGILCDDSSMDFLTNVEMSQALRVAEFAQDEADVAAIFQDKTRLVEIMKRGTEGSLRHLSVIGMDACLMAMIEVQYQIRKFADVMVASQEVEPMKGWPYTEILDELNRRPSMNAAELGVLVVDKYAASYVSTTRRPPNVTQSAIDLSKMGEAALLIRGFSRALAKEYSDDLYLENAFGRAQKSAASEGFSFEDPEYVDLVSFLQALLTSYKGPTAQSSALKAGQKLLDWLLSAQSPIIRNVVTGDFENKAHGISIYVPSNWPSPTYTTLDFKTAGWLKALNTISPPPS